MGNLSRINEIKSLSVHHKKSASAVITAKRYGVMNSMHLDHSISNRTFCILHNSYGTPEFPNCGNQVGADWMENMRRANTEQSMHFTETNTDLSMHFRKANTDTSMYLTNPV